MSSLTDLGDARAPLRMKRSAAVVPTDAPVVDDDRPNAFKDTPRPTSTDPRRSDWTSSACKMMRRSESTESVSNTSRSADSANSRASADTLSPWMTEPSMQWIRRSSGFQRHQKRFVGRPMEFCLWVDSLPSAVKCPEHSHRVSHLLQTIEHWHIKYLPPPVFDTLFRPSNWDADPAAAAQLHHFVDQVPWKENSAAAEIHAMFVAIEQALASVRAHHDDVVRTEHSLSRLQWTMLVASHVALAAIEQDSVALLRCATLTPMQLTLNMAMEAAGRGRVRCLRFLYESGCPVDEMVWRAALEHGQVNCVRFLAETAIPMPSHALTLAAMGGHRELVQYLLLAKQLPVTSAAVSAAASNGHVAVLEFMLCAASSSDALSDTDLWLATEQAKVFEHWHCVMTLTEHRQHQTMSPAPSPAPSPFPVAA